MRKVMISICKLVYKSCIYFLWKNIKKKVNHVEKHEILENMFLY